MRTNVAETKIRVSVEKLIAAIEERREEARAVHEQKIAAHPVALEEWRDKAHAKLADIADKIERGVWLSYEDKQIWPQRPDDPKPFDPSVYDRHIAMLRMTPEETVQVSASDFGAYLR